ncbi:MAG: PIN domain-containing protein [Thermoplasmatota archaeon]
MTSVILDTNALIMPFQFSINLDFELERIISDPVVYVPSSVINELKKLERKEALNLAQKYKIIDVKKRGDKGVLEALEKMDGVLVTNDRELKKEASNKGHPVAFLRGKSHLELLGESF